jgi:hypothetical protein
MFGMRSLLILLFCCNLFLSCDDGDVLDVELDFNKSLTRCGDAASTNYILYDTKEDPSESLTLLFPNNAQADRIFNPVNSGDMETMALSNSVSFIYRTYTGNPNDYICQDIPDASVSVNENYESQSGTAIFISTFIDDDNDGVPNDLEFDGDSDGDGVPNYKDSDDDGDNVPTLNEKPDLNNDGDLSDAQDTDGDGTPDYLDTDDDNDGTLTYFEDENNNGNLFDDLATGAAVARFLDDTVSNSFAVTFVRANEYTRTIKINVTLENIDLSILATDSFELGTYEDSVTY